MNTEAIESRVGERLKNGKLTLATAESCTGGLVAHRITNVPGSSAYFHGGMVTYGNDAKVKFLQVPPAVLEVEGAVSEQVAGAMAAGVREAFASDFGIGVTGIAGPTGGTAEKPVGLVFIAIAWPGGQEVRRNEFSGPRESVKSQTAEAALAFLLEKLE